MSPRTHPPRQHAVGRSGSQYPPLRGAVVKLAHDDPEAAGQLIAGLLPAHGAALAESLDYDLTIRELGTFSITVAGRRAFVARRGAAPAQAGRVPPQRRRADAGRAARGRRRRVGRYFGAARYSGRKRRLKALRNLPETQLTLREAALAGARRTRARSEGALVRRAPVLDREDRWTIAQEIVAETPETWFITSGNGDGLKVTDKPPAAEPDTTVSMTRATFDLLLRGEPAPRGQLPTIRGNAHAGRADQGLGRSRAGVRLSALPVPGGGGGHATRGGGV